MLSGPASITGSKVTLTGAGTVRLRATKAADDDYNETSVETTIQVARKPVTITGIGSQSKMYDGSGDAAVSGTGVISGKVSGDDVRIVQGTAAFADKTVGSGKAVAFTGFALTGADAGKYELTAQPAGVTADITPKIISMNISIAGKAYDGLAAVEILEAYLNDVVTGDAVTLAQPYPAATFTSVEVGENIPVGFSDSFTLTGDDAGNYSLMQPVGITAHITNTYQPTAGTDYTISRSEWGNTDFVITAESGFELSLMNTADGEWTDSFVRDEETSDGSITFYVRNQTTGAISLAVTETYQTDKTAPTGDIVIGESSIRKVLNIITFGLFFKDTQTITVISEDERSGVASVQYYLSDEVLDEQQVSEISEWTVYSDAFTLEPDRQTVVYVKITDAAGNVAYMGSEGMVLDGTAPAVEGIEHEKNYCAPVTVSVSDDNLDTVTLNGEEVTLTESSFTLYPAEQPRTVIATDKSGNSTEVTVMIYDGHEWDEGVVTKAPTAGETGIKTFTCSHCGEIRTEEMEKLAPAMIEGENAQWRPEEGGTLTFRSDAAFEDFIAVLVGNTTMWQRAALS